MEIQAMEGGCRMDALDLIGVDIGDEDCQVSNEIISSARATCLPRQLLT
jgi:hypothetical protein